jgi:hypothetical protein
MVGSVPQTCEQVHRDMPLGDPRLHIAGVKCDFNLDTILASGVVRRWPGTWQQPLRSPPQRWLSGMTVGLVPTAQSSPGNCSRLRSAAAGARSSSTAPDATRRKLVRDAIAMGSRSPATRYTEHISDMQAMRAKRYNAVEQQHGACNMHQIPRPSKRRQAIVSTPPDRHGMNCMVWRTMLTGSGRGWPGAGTICGGAQSGKRTEECVPPS